MIDSDLDGGSFPKCRKSTVDSSPTKLFIGDSEETFEDDSVAASENYPWTPQSSSTRKRPTEKMPRHGDGNPWKKLQQEEESMLEKEAPVVFSNIRVMTPKVLNTNGRSSPSTKNTQNTSTKTTFTMPSPPVLEIVKMRRSNSDAASDVSSLASNFPLEYSLEEGAEGCSPAMTKASISMLQELEKGTQMLENVSKTPTKTDVTSKCLVLLMNPRSKLFEMIQVPFLLERTTVGDILRGIRDEATDPRLAHQTYTGLAYQGMHISAPIVPVDMIAEAEMNGMPLLAVPRNYSAGQIERMANELLGRPQVLQLLKSQLSLLTASTPPKDDIHQADPASSP